MMFAWLVTIAIAAAAAPQSATERRCGWLQNPTPANYWLVDRDGEWTISAQGGFHAEGWDEMPDMATRGWVETNGHYGYGCACLTVTTDRRSRRITRVISATPLPIGQCRATAACRGFRMRLAPSPIGRGLG